MIHDYFADCRNSKCQFTETRSEKLVCPLCGEKLYLSPMIEFGGLSILYDGQRFWLNSAGLDAHSRNPEIDTADIPESLEFMNFFHNGKKHRERIVGKILEIVELELKKGGVQINPDEMSSRIYEYLRDYPSR